MIPTLPSQEREVRIPLVPLGWWEEQGEEWALCEAVGCTGSRVLVLVLVPVEIEVETGLWVTSCTACWLGIRAQARVLVLAVARVRSTAGSEARCPLCGRGICLWTWSSWRT